MRLPCAGAGLPGLDGLVVPSRVFRLSPPDADPSTCIYVDGVEPGYRCLSHWPGNDTPAALKHDLSTGIALRFAELDAAEQLRLLGPFQVVANNHFDTDGVLAAFAVLCPDNALPRQELLLRAAATGDFSSWNGPDALALDLTITGLRNHPASPLVGRLASLDDDRARHEHATVWLLDELPGLLDDPYKYSSLWQRQHERIVEDVGRIERGQGVQVETLPQADLAVVTSEEPRTGVGLYAAAGDCSRVLLVRPGPDGTRFRFVYRVLSWFDLVSRQPPGRAPLDRVVRALGQAETGVAGRWWASDIASPVAQLGFGSPPEQGESLFAQPDPEGDPASGLAPETVVDALLEAFAAAPVPPS